MAVCYAILAAGLVGGLWLFLSLKKELFAIGQRVAGENESIHALLEELQARLRRCEESLKQLDQRLAQLPQLAPPRPSMNLQRRSQVLQMHQRGQTAEEIASTLQIPLAEVELLLKLHELAAHQQPAPDSAPKSAETATAPF